MTAAAIRPNALGSTLRRGFRWWLRELEAALPSWALALVAGDRRCVHLEREEAGELRARLTSRSFAQGAIATARLHAETASEKALLKAIRAAARSRPVVLTAPADLVLTQTVLVPRTALENLPQAVGFGLATWTPFTADMLVYHADVAELRGEQARIRVRMVPRTALEPLVNQARDAGLPVKAVAFGEDVVDDAEPGAPIPKRKSLGGRIDLILFVSALAIAIAILVTLHLRWAAELERLQDGIRTEIAQRTKQAAIERQLSQLGERRKAVLTKRAREPRIAAIVADLAERLPDDAEVVEFGWGAGQGRLVVAAPDRQRVMAALEASPLLKAGPPARSGGETLAIDLSIRSLAR